MAWKLGCFCPDFQKRRGEKEQNVLYIHVRLLPVLTLFSNKNGDIFKKIYIKYSFLHSLYFTDKEAHV